MTWVPNIFMTERFFNSTMSKASKSIRLRRIFATEPERGREENPGLEPLNFCTILAGQYSTAAQRLLRGCLIIWLFLASGGTRRAMQSRVCWVNTGIGCEWEAMVFVTNSATTPVHWSPTSHSSTTSILRHDGIWETLDETAMNKTRVWRNSEGSSVGCGVAQ